MDPTRLFRVSGTVTAPDDTAYTPEYWGDLPTAERVFAAIIDGATERGEDYALVLADDRGTVWRAWTTEGNAAALAHHYQSQHLAEQETA